VDEQVPTVVCPADIVESTDGSECDYTFAPTLNAGNASDNCSAFGDLTISYTVQGPDNSLSGPFVNGSDFDFAVGISQVEYTVIDEAGNSSSCIQLVEIEDTEDPAISCATLVASYATDAGACSYTVQGDAFDPTVGDNCGVASVMNDYNATSSLANAQFPLGTTVVVWTVTDASGNTTTCSISVVVEDNESPAFVNCPGRLPTSIP
jgi:hypothetical protein